MSAELFADYGLEAAPPRNGKPPVDKPVSALEKKMAERQRLSNRYRVLKRQERIEILAAEPRLLDFMRYLRRIGPDDGDELLEAIAESWLPSASADIRHFALNLVGRRCERIRQKLGMPVLDDPLPPETSVFFEARNLLVDRRAA